MQNLKKILLIILSLAIPVSCNGYSWQDLFVITPATDALWCGVELVGAVGSYYSAQYNFDQNKQNNQNILKTIQSDKEVIFPTFSPKAIQFFEKMLTERSLDNKVIFVSGITIGGVEDYATLLGTHDVIINLPKAVAKTLNELLEKELLTDQEQEAFAQIEFWVGHELHHLKRYLEKYTFSKLAHGNEYAFTVGFFSGIVTWATLRMHGIDSWIYSFNLQKERLTWQVLLLF